MVERLADETLKTILAAALEVTDDDFICAAFVSPFASRQYSTSDILLVCKRWMRVATPLLYHTVVLRTTPQAQSLVRALKKNPRFAQYFKKLRLESYCGATGGRVLGVAAHLEEICFAVEFTLREKSAHLAASLCKVAPRRVVIATYLEPDLHDALQDVLKDQQWKIVREFYSGTIPF